MNEPRPQVPKSRPAPRLRSAGHRRWREHPLAPLVNLAWAASVLYIVVLLPIQDVGAWPWAIAAGWLASNLILSVSLRSSLEKSPAKPRGPATATTTAPAAAAAEDLVEGTSLYRDALRRLRRNQLASLSLGLLVFMAALCATHRTVYEVGRAMGADNEFFLTHIDHTRTNKEVAFTPPGRTHWFGTDALGRDIFARTLYGGSISFLVAIVGTIVSLVIGVTWGSIAGYYGGRLDHYMMRTVDVLYGLPFLFLVILIMTLVNGLHVTAASLRPHVERVEELTSTEGAAAATLYAKEHGVDFDARVAVFVDENVPPIVVMFIALGLVEWLTMARIVRGQVISLREREFIVAARLVGASTSRIIRRHLIPNLLGPVTIYTTLTIPSVMLTEAFLSFLGLGISEPDCSWGSLASEGIAAINPIKPYWWLLAYPAAALSLVLFSLNFTGDGLRDALDPRRQR